MAKTKKSKNKKTYKKASSTGNNSPLLLVILAGLIIGMILWATALRGVNKADLADKGLLPVYEKYNLDGNNLVKKTRSDKIKNGSKYVSIYREYNTEDVFPIKNFERDLNQKIKELKFNCYVSRAKTPGGKETVVFVITSGPLEIYTVKINRLVNVKMPDKKIKRTRISQEPKIAIVLDDFGYSLNNVNKLLNIKQPVTFSILPNLQYSGKVAEIAGNNKYETILHLPMESKADYRHAEKGTISVTMTDEEILSRLRKALASVPGVKGVSNHQGSRATEDKRVMRTIMKYLKNKNLYYLDSKSTSDSVCEKTSDVLGERFAKRDVFLDNSSDPDYIENQMVLLKEIALRRGYAVGIGHDRKNTIKVLSRVMPKMAEEGIEFVFLSKLAE